MNIQNQPSKKKASLFDFFLDFVNEDNYLSKALSRTGSQSSGSLWASSSVKSSSSSISDRVLNRTYSANSYSRSATPSEASSKIHNILENRGINWSLSEEGDFEIEDKGPCLDSRAELEATANGGKESGTREAHRSSKRMSQKEKNRLLPPNLVGGKSSSNKAVEKTDTSRCEVPSIDFSKRKEESSSRTNRQGFADNQS